jgi:hypothetical protein
VMMIFSWAAARTSLPVFMCNSWIVAVRMFKSWHPLLVATKLAPQTTHRLVFDFAIFLRRRILSSVALEQFSYCHSDPQAREKNLRSIFAPIFLAGIRPEMFRFAQHDSGICQLGSKPFSLTGRCLGTSR